MSEMDRRDFAAAFAVAVGLGSSGESEAADERAPSLAEALYALLIARCGKHLDEADRKALRARLFGSSVGSLTRSLKLDWRDEPAFVYVPESE